uniref:Uncharacterized protein n=1 Tax=Sphaerodactylus townsendi TaxID=933632 RepID=A0ACB8EMP1_9SAUR
MGSQLTLVSYNIESTSYALLALLKLRKFDEAGPVVKGWLDTAEILWRDIRAHSGSTIMVFQALAQYSDGCPTPKDMNLDAFLKLPGSLQSGQVSQSMESWESAKIRICARYLRQVDATMSIIDVSMLTGYGPATEDLNRLSEGVDRYISKYEIDMNVSERGNLIIYLDKVSHSEDECLEFKLYKYFEAGLVQPGSVTVYSYYSLDDRCTKFYHPSKGSEHLNTICQGDVCRCAEENCFLHNKGDEQVDVQDRVREACKPEVDYVYKAKLIQIEEENGYDNYMMEVLEIIKAASV